MKDFIEVVDYNSNWSKLFTQEKFYIMSALGSVVVDIQHIGSTSVVGLASKPVIDILVGVEDLPPNYSLIAALSELHYLYRGELSVPGRYFFQKGVLRTHHLHMVKPESDLWKQYLLFREFLKAKPSRSEQYATLKRILAAKYPFDRELYVKGKKDFIEVLLSEAKAWYMETL